MSEHTDDDPIQLGGDFLIEFHDIAINLTGIPDDQFRSVDDDGQPATETESLSTPLVEFDDDAINLTGIDDDEFTPLEVDAPVLPPSANGSHGTSVRPELHTPPKSV